MATRAESDVTRTMNLTTVTFTPTGPSAKRGRISLAPLDLRPTPCPTCGRSS